MLPPSSFASSGSPGFSPNCSRRGPGNTTCPLVDTLVCMVRRSYLGRAVETIFISMSLRDEMPPISCQQIGLGFQAAPLVDLRSSEYAE
jgi:hypothetical protein